MTMPPENFSINIQGDGATAGPLGLSGPSPADLIGLGEQVMAVLAAQRAKSAVALLSINADIIEVPDLAAKLYVKAEISRATRSVIFMSASIHHGDKIAMTLTALYKLAPERLGPAKTADIA